MNSDFAKAGQESLFKEKESYLMFFSRKDRKEKLIRLEEFEMWVDPEDLGICKGLIKRAEKISKGKDPGPEREPDFNWIIRAELEDLCGLFQTESAGRLIVCDLGANVGLNTLIMDKAIKRHLPADKYFICAIEPNSQNARFLQKNISHNQANAGIFPCAISDYCGEGQFHISARSNHGALLPHSLTELGAQKVRVFSLPAFAESFQTGQPNFIKMDIEGGEVEVLKGGRDYLADCRFPCKIIIEVHPKTYNEDRSLEKELRCLFERGWTAKYMVSAFVVQPDKFKEAGLAPFKQFEIFRQSRAIYKDFSEQQFLDFACHTHLQEIPGRTPRKNIVRSILIEKKS